MEFAVSSLPFSGGREREMGTLPPELGIEIFFERGGEAFWAALLPELLEGRTGSLGIHGPSDLDFAGEETEESLYRRLRESFRLYHRFGASRYIVHTNVPASARGTEEEQRHRREQAGCRLAEASRFCREEGVLLLVENVPMSGLALFGPEDFPALFQAQPDLSCVLDTGHAHVEGFDLANMQRTLGGRILEYHIHDNNGVEDRHLSISERVPGGICGETFLEEAVRHTPEAVLTLEYKAADVEGLVRDWAWLRQREERYLSGRDGA